MMANEKPAKAWKPIRIFLAMACVLWLAACSGPGGEASRTASAESSAARPAPIAGSGLSPPVQGDAQVLGVLQVMDENEIALARQASQRNLGGASAEFALAMQQRHEQMLASTRALSPQPSEQANALRARGEATVASLKLEDDLNAYRNAFLASAAADYADALRIIDAELLPVVHAEPVRVHVQETRRLFAQGYEQAQAAASTR